MVWYGLLFEPRNIGAFTYIIRSHVTCYTSHVKSRVSHTTSRLGRKREILLHPKLIPRLAELGDRPMGCC